VSRASQHLCNALIRRSLELRALYLHAATEVREPGLRSILAEGAQSLALLTGELQGQMRTLNTPPATRSGLLNQLRRRLSTSVSSVMPRSDDAWIMLLARHESGLLGVFEQALDAAPLEFMPVLQRQGPRLRAIHLDMHSLTKAVGH
jgi:uncharacterized protein (TIGR02284 family)